MSRSGNGNYGGGGKGGNGGNGGKGGYGKDGGKGGDGNGKNCAPKNDCPPEYGDGGESHKAALISARADVDLDARVGLFKDCSVLDVQADLDADVGLGIG